MKSVMHANDAQPATVMLRNTITIAQMMPMNPRNTQKNPNLVIMEIGFVADQREHAAEEDVNFLEVGKVT